MHPDLVNNSTFLRYYKKWQDDPGSIVFVPIAEMFLMYGMSDDAINVCLEGLKRSPDLISGHLTLAKAYIEKSDWNRANEQVGQVLQRMPNHPTALDLLGRIIQNRNAHEVSLDGAVELNVPGETYKYDIFDDDDEITEEVNLAEYIKEIAQDEDVEDMVSLRNWNTITMARIFASQGYYDRAVRIYDSILDHDPQNLDAQNEVSKLRQRVANT